MSNTLRQKEKSVKWWFQKIDIAYEYEKIGLDEEAWRLFNEAILKRFSKDKDDTVSTFEQVYLHMAKILEERGNSKSHFYIICLLI